MHRLPGITAVALIVVGGATASVPPTITGGSLDFPGSAAISASASSLPSPQLRTTPAPPPVRVAPEVMVRNASLRAPRPQLPEPMRIRYPGIGADMSTTDVGVAADGIMEIPDDAAVAGWYRYSAAPTEASGSTIIAAHAGSVPTPRGPLYDLRKARVGQLVEILDSAGARTRWQVAQVEQLRKKALDLRPYFSRSGPRRLVLFTCGGRWDPARQSYDDNIIVTATPAR